MTLTVTHPTVNGATTSSFTTISYSYNDSSSSNRNIKIEPTLNTEVGVYPVTMRLTLDEHTSKFTDFTITITVTPC